VFSRELEQAGPMLQEYLDDARLDDDADSPSMLLLSDLTQCPGSKLLLGNTSSFPGLIEVYGRLEDQWIKSQPATSSGVTRLTRFNITRRVSVELSLSSIAVLVREKGPMLHVSGNDSTDAVLPTIERDEIRREDYNSFPSSQIASDTMGVESFGLPTPAQTPSLHSHNSIAVKDPAEDPAITRLRRYAVGIETPDELHQLPLLSRWPPIPGVDPTDYNWNPAEQPALLDEKAEKKRGQKAKRDEAQRKKRTERFLNQGISNDFGPISQPPTSKGFGSQPEIAEHAASSQTVADLPMTQPGRGIFGSRHAERAKQKPKRRRNAGF